MKQKVELVAYHTLKVYPDNRETLSVKVGQDLSNTNHKRDNNKNTTLANTRRSMRRAYNEVKDICDCNEFKWFLTFTFDSKKVDRYNDDATRKVFKYWREQVKEKYPQMFYLAVPEYHKKGALHYHLLVGGMTAEDLKLQFFDKKKCMDNFIDVYTTGIWDNGFSTCSEIQQKENCCSYVMKYITKADADIRFFRKARYHCSHNCIRPDKITAKFNCTDNTTTVEKIEQFYDKKLVFADNDYKCYKFE